MTERIVATEAAVQFIDELRRDFGPVIFLLSGGCCDGSVPNCFKVGEFMPSQTTLLLGTVGGAEFWLGHQEYIYYENSQLTLDVRPGQGGDFSLDCGRGRAFETTSRPFTDAELATVQPPVHGA